MTAPVTEPLDLRLAPAAALAWAGAWWAVAAPPGVALAVAGLGPVLVMGFGVVRNLRRHRGLVAATAMLAVAAGSLVLAATAIRTERRVEPPLPQWARDHVGVRLTGTLAGDPSRSRASTALPDERAVYTVQLDADRVVARGRSVHPAGPLLVIGGPKWQGLAAGTRIRAQGRLEATAPGDPAVAVIFVRAAPEVLDTGHWWWRGAERLREGLRRACQGLPEDAGGLLPGLVVGDTSHLPPSLGTAMRNAGLTHLTAVSGSNITLFAGAVLLAAAWGGAGRRTRALVAALAVAGFVVLARPEPSVLRAAVMGSLALTGLAMVRTARGLPLLAAAVVTLMLIDPWLSRSFGFALSVLATAALIVLVPAWLERAPPRIPRPVVAALAVPVAAFVVTAPVTVVLQPTVSLVAIPANLLAAPAVAPATVIGVLAAALAPVWPFGAHLLAAVGCLATGWIALVARTAAGVPGAQLPWPAGLTGAVLLGVVLLVVVLRLTLRPRGDGGEDVRAPGPGEEGGSGEMGESSQGLPGQGLPGQGLPGEGLLSRGLPGEGDIGGRGRARRRRRPTATWAVVALVAGWFVVPRLPGIPGGAWPPAGWWAVQCDVGQGDALVLSTGPGRAVLIDTGPDPALVDGCLNRLEVKHLDLVLITHFHADHADGLPGALRGRSATAILVTGLAEPAGSARQVRSTAARAHVPVLVASAGAAGRAGPAGDLRWRVLWPNAEAGRAGAGPLTTGGPSTGDEGAGPNDASLVTVVESRGRSLLALGDVEPEAQEPLRRLVRGMHVDVVKVAHHGSVHQDPALYAGLGAKVALIGVGVHNDYGHPSARTLAMLRADGALVTRTDTDGDVAVVVRGDALGVVRRGGAGEVTNREGGAAVGK